MRSIAYFLLGAALVCAPAYARARGPGKFHSSRIDAAMRAAVTRGQAHGLTIAIVRDGIVVYEHAYGMRNADAKLPATVMTNYEIGSITKQFTAAAIMQLVDAGKVSLNAPLATYLPHAPHASEVTIRELLSHTSGLPDYLDGPTVMTDAGEPQTPKQLLARIAGKPLDFKPGTQWEYSNTNYILLGRVIEVASGEPYEKYLFEHVLANVPGADFATMSDEAKLPSMSRGYTHGEPAAPLDNSWAWSAGNLVGTVGDMILWDAALSSGKVVPAADYASMTAVQTPPGAKETYGFAFVVDRYDDQPRIWHNGGTFGFNTSDQYYPAQGTRIIVFTNDAEGMADGLAEQIFDDLYPAISAAADEPFAGEDPAYTARVERVFATLLSGKIDRTQFDERANAGLTQAVVKAASAEFAAYGPPQRYIFRGCRPRAGGKVCKYLVMFPNAHMILTLGNDPDGKFNEIFLGSQ